MSAFARIVQEAAAGKHQDPGDQHDGEAAPRDQDESQSHDANAPNGHANPQSTAAPSGPHITRHRASTSQSGQSTARRSSHSAVVRSAHPGTPAARTGPPSSLNLSYSLPGGRYGGSRPPSSYFAANGAHDLGNYFTDSPRNSMIRDHIDEEAPSPSQGISRPELHPQDTEFRGALEYADPEQRESERKEKERWERRRASRMGDGDSSSWNPVKWFNVADSPVSPKEERGSWFDWGDSRKDKGKEKQDSRDDTERQQEQGSGAHDDEQQKEKQAASLVANKMKGKATYTPQPPHKTPSNSLSRSQSLPYMRRGTSSRPAAPKWQRLRSLLPSIVPRTPGPSVVISHNVNITDELMAGGLSTIMLKLWFERDEKDQRRVPVLLHRLRIRISDSLYPLSGHKAVFRIECEYANGAARWVIYRQLRDFISLHTHYTASNAWNRNIEGMPDFPATSLCHAYAL
jgi:phospholipase D1/2